jgi:hypothetical protein
MPTVSRPPNVPSEAEPQIEPDPRFVPEARFEPETRAAAEPRIEPEPRVSEPAPPVVIPEPRDVTREPRIESSRRGAITRGVTVGGSTAEAMLGLAAIVLAVFALSGLLVMQLTAIAVIVVATALLAESASLAARAREPVGSDATRAVLLGGVGADTVSGLAAITLAVLALFGIHPFTLLPVAILVLGAGLLFSGASAIVELVRSVASQDEIYIASNPLSSMAGVHVLVGAGALILGILGVLGAAPILLTLVATLTIGASLLLSGASLGARLIAPPRPLT